jgi:competence protein ComEA
MRRLRAISEQVSGRVAAAWNVAWRAISLGLVRPFGGIARRVRGSVWTRPLLKAMAALGALLVLAWIGHRSSVHTASAALESASAPPPVTTPVARGTPQSTSNAGSASAPPPVATLAPSTQRSAPPTTDEPVYLNTATIDDLRRLPGIGPKRAQAIVDLRGKQGRFHQIEDLMKVRGIGRSTLKRLRPLVRLDPPPGPIADASAG